MAVPGTPAVEETSSDRLWERSTGLLENLSEMELTREAYWARYPATSPTRLRWRAQAVRHALHVTAGESILEIGAGSGLWTEHVRASVGAGPSITEAVFNADLAVEAESRAVPDCELVLVRAGDDLPAESFDYVIGTAILSHDRYQENLDWIRSLLRPGGQLLFFEANYWNPQVFAKAQSLRVAAWSGNAECQIALRKPALARALVRQGFVGEQIVPYDILHPRTPGRMVRMMQSAAFVAEHLPGLREMCGTLFISARRPEAATPRRPPDLAVHDQFRDAVSVVVPCHDESMNLVPLVRALTEMYDAYIHEVVLVDDNSVDDTADVAERLAEQDPRVKLVRRLPPPGVGRALRDGYAAASGQYILTMDCDFEMLVPELTDLFDAVAAGHDGAMGSRFSHDSILLNYPAGKMLGNRAFHVLVRALFRWRVRDVSNNLKLYRADILRDLEITQDGFAANAETGLAPLLAGYDIAEVPIAWINRDSAMGTSTFRVAKVAPGYVRALIRLLRSYVRLRGPRRTTPRHVRRRGPAEASANADGSESAGGSPA
jgi:dolichol-phosphate mannosyltransferase